MLRTWAFVLFGLGTGHTLQYAIGFFCRVEGNYGIQSLFGPVLLFVACALFAAHIWMRDAKEKQQWKDTVKHLRDTLPDSY